MLKIFCSIWNWQVTSFNLLPFRNCCQTLVQWAPTKTPTSRENCFGSVLIISSIQFWFSTPNFTLLSPFLWELLPRPSQLSCRRLIVRFDGSDILNNEEKLCWIAVSQTPITSKLINWASCWSVCQKFDIFGYFTILILYTALSKMKLVFNGEKTFFWK